MYLVWIKSAVPPHWGPSPVGQGDLRTSLSGLSSLGMDWRGRDESLDAGVYVAVVSEVMETMALPLLCGEGGAMAEFQME